MPPTTRRKIGAGFAAAFLILVVGALSFHTARQALDAAGWVAHTHEVLSRLDDVLADLIDVETGTRGYVITGEARFLEPYTRGSRALDTDLGAVRRLTADNARQQRRLDALMPVIRDRVAIADSNVRARRDVGFAAAAALVTAERGKAAMDDVRRRIAEMQVEERVLLADRTAQRRASEQRAALVVAIGSLIAFGLVATMIRVIQQDITIQQQLSTERDALLVRERAALAQLAGIQRITDGALAPLALDDLMTELMGRVREVLAADAACVLLLMRDGVHLELCKCVGLTADIHDRVHVPLGVGAEGGIAARRESTSIADIAASDVFDPVVREHFASFVGAPLVLREGPERGRVIGIVHATTVAPRVFTDEERELLTLVAERAAGAIERGRLYQAQRRAEETFRMLVENVEDYAIHALDPAGRVSSWNDGARRLFGYEERAALGLPIAAFYPPEHRAAADQALANALDRGRHVDEGWRVRADGSRLWAEAHTTPMRAEDGHLLGFAKITRDLSERRRADEALLGAKEAAEAANQAKSQFLATMSHEIRTPINAILGYTELLEMDIDGPLTDAQRARLGRVRASSRHLLGLVNEVLDLAKIEAAQLRVEHTRSGAGDAVASALALVYPQASARGLAVLGECPPGDEVAYLGDPHRVEQILVNLLSNAVKFTPDRGRVTVSCGQTDSLGDRAHAAGAVGTSCWCVIRVTDTGIGIAPEHREAVFEPFVQAASEGESIYTRQHGGTGLGLAISRRLARLMGGDITLESTLGQGSTFALWLPAPVEVRVTPTGETTGCVTDERRLRARPPVGLAVVGETLRRYTPEIVATHVRRLREELGAPNVDALRDAELEDHVGTMLAEVARTLVLIEQLAGESTSTLRDGTDIQRLIAERHGAQRASLGWSLALHARESTMLREDIEQTLRGHLAAGVDADVDLTGAMAVVTRLLEFAERAGARGLRAASSQA